MTEEFDFSFNQVNVRNISSIGQKMAELEEQRILELYELASEIADSLLHFRGEMNVCDMLTLLSEDLHFQKGDVHQFALNVNLQRLNSFLSALSIRDRILFTDLLVERLRFLEIEVNTAVFLPENDSPEIFTYVKNSLSDEAYDVFSEDFFDPKLKYSLSLKEAAALAAEGSVTYALLPLEEAGGERLHTASELIFRQDLKINRVTPVFGLDGSVDMKFALVSKGFTVPKIEKDDDVYFEIRVSISSSISEILLAAENFAASVYRINTLSFNTDGEDESFYSIVFKSNTGNFTELIAYLTLFIDSYTPVGVYKNLE